MEEATGFKSDRKTKKGSYDEYIGKYVRIIIYGNDRSAMGRLDEILDGNIILRNHLRVYHHPKFGQLLSINMGKIGEKIQISAIHSIEEDGLENLLNYCIFQNEQQVRSITKTQNNK